MTDAIARESVVRRPRPYIPRVEIVTPVPTPALPTPPGVFTQITVDGEPWMIFEYHVAQDKDIQRVTLTFGADVTITHPKEAS